jgi:heptosyltransferase-2
LFVRLPNHLGDACMCVPALDALAPKFALTLIGKPWAKDLFEAYGWPVISLAGSQRAQVQAIRAAMVDGHEIDGNAALLFTHSFSTALQLRFAGLRPRGYSGDARGALLARALPPPERWAGDLHTVAYYFELAHRAFDLPVPPVPAELQLRISDRARANAHALLSAAGVAAPYIVLCPVAVGLHRGRVKAWNEFGRLCRALLDRNHTVVSMPGPGEREAVQAAIPEATLLPASDVGSFAALLAGSRLVIANDSGPGHLAAAVGAPLLSIFGVTDPLKTRPWGSRAMLVGGSSGWPAYEAVESAALAALS